MQYLGAMSAVRADELSAEVAALWCDLLDLREVSDQADFLDLGGHSLIAIRLTAVLRERISEDIPLVLVFEHPVLSDYVDALRSYVD